MPEEPTPPVTPPATPPLGAAAAPEPPTTPPVPLDFDSEDTYQQFVGSLGQEYADIPLMKETKNLKSLVDQSIHAQRSLGKKRLEAPSEDWGAEEWNQFHDSIAPKDPSAYEFPESVEVSLDEDSDPVEYKFDEATSNQLREVSQRLKLSPVQAQALAEEWSRVQVSGNSTLDEQIKGTIDRQIDAVRSEWGDQFELNHRAANEAYEVFAKEVPELAELMQWSPVVPNHPGVLKLFHRLAPLVQDMGVASGSGRIGSSMQGETVAGLKAELDQLLTENSAIINSEPGTLSLADQQKRNRILERRAAIYKKMYGDEE